MFIPGRSFLPSLMFESEAGAYPSKAPFRRSTLGYVPGLKRLNQAVKAFQEQTLYIILNVHKLQTSRSLTFGPCLPLKSEIGTCYERSSLFFIRAKKSFIT